MGYDKSLFLSPVHNELICSICHAVFENPIYLPLCRHVFCMDCISGWLDQASQANQRTCPIDKTIIKISKEEVKKKKVSYALTNIIQDQIMVCKYRKNGCQDTFSLSNFAKHLSQCKFKPAREEDDSLLNNPVGDSTSGATNIDQASPATAPAATARSVPKKTVQKTTATAPATPKSNPPKNLCKVNHPKRNDSAKTYFHPSWPHPTEKKLVKLMFLSIDTSYKPYTLASYLKNLTEVDVYCIHTDAQYDTSFTKDLSVRVLEEQYEKVLKPELWPSKVSISVNLGLKQITLKGSLKLTRAENFYGFDEKTTERKEKRKRKKEEKEQQNQQKQLEKEAAAEAKQQSEQSKKSDQSAKSDPPANNGPPVKGDQSKKADKQTKGSRKKLKKNSAAEEASSNAMEVGESSKSK